MLVTVSRLFPDTVCVHDIVTGALVRTLKHNAGFLWRSNTVCCMTVVPARAYADHVIIATADEHGHVFLWTGVDKGVRCTFYAQCILTQVYTSVYCASVTV